MKTDTPEDRLNAIRDAANLLIDRLESTQRQAFFDTVKPELVGLCESLQFQCQTPYGLWLYDRKGYPIKPATP